MSQLPGVREGDDDYELRRQELVYDGKYFQVRREEIRLPNGVDATHEVLHYPTAVSVIPVLEEVPGNPELILVEQFRNSVRGYIHEIPAGMVEADEDFLGCARRELEEETGYRADRWTHIATILPTPGISSRTMTFFLAEGLRRTGRQDLEPSECLTVRRVPLRGLIDAVVLGESVAGVPEIVDGKTFLAICYLGARPGRSAT